MCVGDDGSICVCLKVCGLRRSTASVCPSGLRGYVQVVMFSNSWVQIPQLTFSSTRGASVAGVGFPTFATTHTILTIPTTAHRPSHIPHAHVLVQRHWCLSRKDVAKKLTIHTTAQLTLTHSPLIRPSLPFVTLLSSSNVRCAVSACGERLVVT